jgi:hypothetical protein
MSSNENTTQSEDMTAKHESAVAGAMVETPERTKAETRWERLERLQAEALEQKLRVDKQSEEGNALNLAEHPNNVRRANEGHEAYLAELRHVQAHRASVEQHLALTRETGERSAAALERIADALEDLTTKPGGAP